MAFAKALIGHCSHIEVFHTYSIIPIGYLGTKLMHTVLSLIRNVAFLAVYQAELFHKVLRLSFTLTRTLLLREPALQLCSLALRLPIEMWYILRMPI